MMKKIFALASFSVVALSLSADVLRKEELAHFQALTGLSHVESRECLAQAHENISTLHRMGYSDKEINSMIKQQVGAVSKKVQDPHADCVSKKTMWLLLAITTIVSSYVAANAAVGAYVSTKINAEIN